MAKDRNGTLSEKSKSPNREEDKEERKSKSKQRENAHPEKKMRENPESESGEERKHSRSKGKAHESSDSESEDQRKRRKSEGRKRKSRKRYSSEEDSDSEGADSGSESSDSGDSESESSGSDESEEERRRRKRRERRRRREREEERERKRRKKEKERKMRRREKEEEKKKKKRRKEKKKEKMEKGKKGAVTNSWGKYGIIRETDMWTKRPEFTAWLAEVKQVNLESLPNWEEKQMFKAFMEDHNTATFPSKKYYNLDAYYRRKMEKEQQKGFKKVLKAERTVFNDEEQRRLELLLEREKHKEEQVEVLKRSMQGGMAQAMKEQALLREEMALQYKLGNSEAAAAIQRRLDPDVAM